MIEDEEKTKTVRVSGCSFGCFGCLLEIVGLLGLIYIIAHWSEIWRFILH